MLQNKKNVFWEALLITLVVFILGLFFGIMFEGNKIDQLNEYYIQSEIGLIDSLALLELQNSGQESCDILVNINFNFADKIYGEALTLEKYEESEKIGDNLKLIHTKYDLMRTLLWMNSVETKEKCGKKFHTAVYLYEFETKDLVQKATQTVWSRILFDVKSAKGDEVILIPIAVDNDLVSLDSLLEEYELTQFPALIIDEKEVIYDLESVDDAMIYLK